MPQPVQPRCPWLEERRFEGSWLTGSYPRGPVSVVSALNMISLPVGSRSVPIRPRCWGSCFPPSPPNRVTRNGLGSRRWCDAAARVGDRSPRRALPPRGGCNAIKPGMSAMARLEGRLCKERISSRGWNGILACWSVDAINRVSGEGEGRASTSQRTSAEAGGGRERVRVASDRLVG